MAFELKKNYRTIDGLMFDILVNKGLDYYNTFMVCLGIFERGFLPYMGIEEFAEIVMSSVKKQNILGIYNRRRHGRDAVLNFSLITDRDKMVLGYIVNVYGGNGKLTGVSNNYVMDYFNKAFGIVKEFGHLINYSLMYRQKRIVQISKEERNIIMDKVREKLLKGMKSDQGLVWNQVDKKIHRKPYKREGQSELISRNFKFMLEQRKLDTLTNGTFEPYFTQRQKQVVEWAVKGEFHKVSMKDVMDFSSCTGFSVSDIMEVSLCMR